MTSLNGKKHIWWVLLFVLVLAIVWLGVSVSLPVDSNKEEQVLFIIKKGMSSGDISKALKAQGLIRSSIAFDILAFLKNKDDNLVSGGYDLSFNMSASQILEKLSSGDVAKEDLTIIEGWNLRDIAWWFENQGMFQAEEMFELVGFPAVVYTSSSDIALPKDFSEEFDFLASKPTTVGLEGYFFPDTYQIAKGKGIEEIIKKFLNNFGKKVSQGLRDEITKQGKTLFEVLTMASLLEKEVQTRQDKEIVAGILWKRLGNNWKLQVDACLTYLTGKSSKELTKDDMEIDSLYNTYKYYGLPLGPISNPGLDSIEAAVYYKNSGYWYYLTTPEGETKFSKTLDEHNFYKAKYLK